MSDTATKPCHVCAMVATGGGLVYSDEHFSAFTLADRPGWVLYATKRHGGWLWDLDEGEALGLGGFLRSLSGTLREVTGATHVYYVGLGENTLHFHGILAARHEPFAKDIQASLAARGAEVADQVEADRVATALREKLQAG